MSLSSLPSQLRTLITSLINSSRQKDLQKGKALHAHIIKTGSSSSVHVANGLVNLYVKCGDLPTADLVFEATPNKDVFSWNNLINAYSHHQPSSLVMHLFRRMRTLNNVIPNAHTFAGLFTAAAASHEACHLFWGRQIHSVAIKLASFHDVFVGSSLVNLYCKMGLVVDARV